MCVPSLVLPDGGKERAPITLLSTLVVSAVPADGNIGPLRNIMCDEITLDIREP